MSTARRRLAAGALATLLATAGCGGGGRQADDERTLTVLAAASLTETFDELAAVFEEENPGVRVRLVLDSSATLATQVREGAPGDVLATADESTMALAEGFVEEPAVFATNVMVLVVPGDDAAGVTGVGRLSDPDVAFVTCVETAPCGSVARRVLERNGVTAAPRSLEVDVRAVLAKVVDDEADAGLVYATDARVAGAAVQVRTVPGAGALATRYPVAVVDGADETDLARDWVDLLLSRTGREVLRRAGFGLP